MFPQVINVGASPNDGQGDPIRTAFIKTNTNFAELFALPNPTPPTSLIGNIGDVPGMYAYNSNYFYYCFASYNGNSNIWAQVSQVNSVSVSQINNGNSNVNIAGANANVTITVNSVPNIATFSTVGLSVTGNITGNYIIGDGSQLTNLPAGNYSNANVADYLPTYSGNIGTLTAVGNVETISFFVGDGTYITNVSANLSNVTTDISTTGNIFADVGFFNDINLNNAAINKLLYTDNNRNIYDTSFSYDGNLNVISGTGNITAGYFLGDGSQLTNLPAGNYSNANVADYLPTYSGDFSANIITINNLYSPNFYSNAVTYANATGYLTNTNLFKYDPGLGILTVGAISLTGNITANYFIGDGSQLTNLPSGNYSNANVASYLPTYTGNLTANIISATGNVYTDGYFVGNFSGNISGNLVVPGSNTQVLYNNSGNAGASAGLTFDSASNVLASTGNISTTGNVIAVSIYTSGVLSAGGNVRGSNLNTTGIVSATGNVYGNYFVGNISGSVANAVFANIANVAYNVDGANVTGIVSTANVAYSVDGANVVGTVANATFANTSNVAYSVAGANVTGSVANAVYSNTAGVAYSVAGANVTGTVANATFATTSGSSTTAVTVTANAQPNITSVGTLTTLSVTGNVSSNNVIANSFVTSNGFFKLPSYTTAQISALTGMTGGEMVYNSDIQLVQTYQMDPSTATMGWVSWTVAVYQ